MPSCTLSIAYACVPDFVRPGDGTVASRLSRCRRSTRPPAAVYRDEHCGPEQLPQIYSLFERQRHRAGLTVRVILASGQSATDEVNTALSRGARAFVSKLHSIDTMRNAPTKAMG